MLTDLLLESLAHTQLHLPKELLAACIRATPTMRVPSESRVNIPWALSLDEHSSVAVEFDPMIFQIDTVADFDVYLLFPVAPFDEWASQYGMQASRYVVFPYNSKTKQFHSVVLFWGRKEMLFTLLDEQPLATLDLQSLQHAHLSYHEGLCLLPIYISTAITLLTIMDRAALVDRGAFYSFELVLHETPTTIQ